MELTYTRLSAIFFLLGTVLIALVLTGITVSIIHFNKQPEVSLQTRKRFAVFIGVIVEWLISSVVIGSFIVFTALATILPSIEGFHSLKTLIERSWQEVVRTPPDYLFSIAIILNISLSLLSGYVAGRLVGQDEIKVGFVVAIWAVIVSTLSTLIIKAFVKIDNPPVQQIVQYFFIIGFAALGSYFSFLQRIHKQTVFTWLVFGNVFFLSIVAVNYDTYININAAPNFFGQTIVLGRYLLCLAVAFGASIFMNNIIPNKASFEYYRNWFILISIFSILCVILGARIENHIQPLKCCGDGAFSAWGYPYSFSASSLENSSIARWDFLALTANIIFSLNSAICLIFIFIKTRLWLFPKTKLAV